MKDDDCLNIGSGYVIPCQYTDYCKDLPTGYYEYPFNCSGYISCDEREMELKYCSSDKLFNGALQICDTTDAVECKEREYLRFSQNLCLGLPDLTVLPSLGHCNEFIICMDEQVVINECPNQFAFNSHLLLCDPLQDVVCYNASMTASRSREEIGYFSSSDEPCIDQKEGSSFPLFSDCSQYILCLGNDESYIARCPANSWYDPITGICGPNVSPTACEEIAETSSTAVPTTPSPDELCADEELGTSYPFVANCEMYILCLGDGESSIVNCIFNAWYDPKTGICGPDVSPTACQEGTVTMPATTTAATTSAATTSAETTAAATTSVETTSAATTVAPTEPPTDAPIPVEICGGLNQGEYVAYPDNCGKYIVCTEPIPIAFYCTPGYYFNQQQQQCVDWGQSDCSGMMTTTALPPGQATTTPQTPNICSNNAGATFPYTENCRWFVRCMNDEVYMISVCSNGEYYDPVSGACSGDVSAEACREMYTTPTTTTTTAATTTTTEATTTTTATTPKPSPCDGVEEGTFVPYPNDCTKFIRCVSPTPIVHNCVEGQEFSAELQRCMAPWVANCTATTATFEATATTLLPRKLCEGYASDMAIPYPHNCSKFIVCQEPIPVGYDCPIGKAFSEIDLCCTDAELANCNGGSRA